MALVHLLYSKTGNVPIT